MPPYHRKNKVTDIERPIATHVLGRDVMGINAHIPSVSKSDIDLQDDEFSLEYGNAKK